MTEKTEMTEKNAATHLKEAAESFHKVVDFSMRVSLELSGTPATTQTELSSFVHTKMCINGTSIEHMLNAALKDHSAVDDHGSLCSIYVFARDRHRGRMGLPPFMFETA